MTLVSLYLGNKRHGPINIQVASFKAVAPPIAACNGF
jgi:hypothetical protein